MSEDLPVRITFYKYNNDPENSIHGTFGIHIVSSGLYLNKARLVKKKDGTYYVAPPAEKYICKRSGQPKYVNYWFFGEESSEAFQKTVKEALIQHFTESKIPNPWST